MKDYFGGKVLTEAEGKPSPVRRFRSFEEETSLLSVVADSAEVEVVLVTKANMQYLPELVQKQLQLIIGSKFQAD